ncbi:hypothetical protein HPO96_03855 [Kribbella sandramycini]|uniref:Clp R domain-containing protein n=1 Tax=Kribbella sandramycini TaxID=60450 RepID=A0A7Y4KVA5_9ACTN|nr:hypothetical protein [Kribbella sandramycini]MBB6568032.1 hypothetical protein [Kribbella sandramycini]NOL39374.1 hypothetical protein [Kribbella sandramycini]
MDEVERYTGRAAGAVVYATRYAEADERGAATVGDLLTGLLIAGPGVAVQVLAGLRVELPAPSRVVLGYRKNERWAPADELAELERRQLSDEVLEVLRVAAEEAGGGHLGTEHLLLGLVRQGAVPGVALDDVRGEVGRQLAAFHRGRPEVLAPEVADELIGVARLSLPGAVAELDVRIAEAQRQKEAAVDVEDFEAAASRR